MASARCGVLAGRTRTASALGWLALLVVISTTTGGCEGAVGEVPRLDPKPAFEGDSDGDADPGAAGSGPADEAMRAENPSLFESALSYFPGAAERAAPKRLVRLTRQQLDLTTAALLPAHYQDSTFAALPRDPLQTNYEYADNLSFHAANFTPYTGWVRSIAQRVATNPRSVIDCVSPDDTACLMRESERFVRRAFRDVVSSALLARFSGFFVNSVKEAGLSAATAELVDLTLTSPHYVFRDEVQTSDGSLSPAQQLESLSYTLADAPPEALGLSASGAALRTREGRERIVRTLLERPEARKKLGRFFISWLEVKDPDEFTIASELFPLFTPTLAAAMVADTRAFLDRQLARAAPTLRDVTQATGAFVSSATAPLYEVRTPSAPSFVELDPVRRLGIFTQPALIASHSGPTTTRLVKRGVFFTRKVMCLPLGLPPAGLDTSLPETRGETERQRVESATAQPACKGCHASINPFGFMQENYDAIGRFRELDEGQRIDASIRVEFLDEGPLATSSPVEALRALTSSLRFQQCFARQLFRFYMSRDELEGDDPLLRRMFFAFANRDQDLVAMLEILGGSALFSRRAEEP